MDVSRSSPLLPLDRLRQWQPRWWQGHGTLGCKWSVTWLNPFFPHMITGPALRQQAQKRKPVCYGERTPRAAQVSACLEGALRHATPRR
ncbi:hypothetical protein E2C01_093905 [Portunus trituberculatus]|uniref:Uncharacterized protein n=1 Tax=Portunus trituberculatus TaxID=210409 RepID=A0A5B7JR32_PORTR|nr:hypothetical protein [Portunus trituberculatus]